MGSRRREQAVLSVNEACPRCGSRRVAGQAFCVECGLRLPVLAGRVPALRSRWLRRLGWYPGDWVWLALPTFAIAVAGGAAAIELVHRDRQPADAPATVIAPVPRLVSMPADTTPAANGRIAWPAGVDGWTVVLVSSPATRGAKVPLAIAARAAHNGLPEVGILESSGYSSLHPGYYVVFSGVYKASADAQIALQTVQARGFGGAYQQQISP